MTRKDYIALADAFARTRPFDSSLMECATCDESSTHFLHSPANDCRDCKAPQDHHEYRASKDANALKVTWATTRDAVMVALKRDNPNFDRQRFIAATEA